MNYIPGDLVELVDNYINPVVRDEFMGESLMVNSVSDSPLTKGLLRIIKLSTKETFQVYPGFVQHVFSNVAKGTQIKLENGCILACIDVSNDTFTLEDQQIYSKRNGHFIGTTSGFISSTSLIFDSDGITARLIRAISIEPELYSFRVVMDMLSKNEIKYARRQSWVKSVVMSLTDHVLMLSNLNDANTICKDILTIDDIQANDWVVIKPK